MEKGGDARSGNKKVIATLKFAGATKYGEGGFRDQMNETGAGRRSFHQRLATSLDHTR
jgi:hypothetical protein